MFFKIAVCGVAFVSNDVVFWTGSTSVERETLRLGVYLTEYQLVKQRIGVIPSEAVLQALANAGGSKGNLTGDEGLTTTLTLVIKQNTGAAEHVVGLTVFLHNPEAIEFGHGIGAVRMEGGVLVLGNFFYLAVELGGGGLIDTAGLLQVAGTHGLEHAEHTGGIDIGRELGRVEADLHVALGRKIIYLIGLHLVHYLDYRHGVAQVGIVQVEVGLTLQMRNALPEVYTGAADDAVHLVALLQKELTQIGTVLSGYTCY